MSDFLVYVWRNLINNKEYVGKDEKGGQRQKSHLCCLSRGCMDCSSLLHKAIRKYGLENFSYEILELGFTSRKQLLQAEKEHIMARNSLVPGGYNMLSGDGFYEGSSEKFERILDYIPPKTDLMNYQVIKIRTRNHDKPLWSRNNNLIRELLLRSFPNLKISEKQRQKAGRWARVIYLYYWLGMPHNQIAEEMSIGYGALTSLLRNIRRVGNGTTANKKLRGTRSIGRPRIKERIKNDTITAPM